MDKRFLQKYEEDELQKQQMFLERVLSGGFTEGDTYPPRGVLLVSEPYAYSIPLSSIWPLIPFYGTTVVRLIPVASQQTFEEYHGFGVEDIPRLVSFAQESGRVQFVLDYPPTWYQGLHFLQPIFQELRPPVRARLTLEVDQSDIDQFKSKSPDLVRYLSSFKVNQGLLKDAGSSVYILWGSEREPLKSASVLDDTIEMSARYYAELRSLGFDELADEIWAAIQERRYGHAALLLGAVRDFLLQPLFDPLKAIRTLRRDEGELMAMAVGLSDDARRTVEFPYEVGSFLCRKLSLIVPRNVDGAIELTDRYEEKGLRTTLAELNRAVEEERAESVLQNSSELQSILERLWAETERSAKLQRHLEQYGISLAIAAIGTIITLPIGGVGGLLAGLGFAVADKSLGNELSRRISEKLMNWRRPSWMVHLYDLRTRKPLSKG